MPIGVSKFLLGRWKSVGGATCTWLAEPGWAHGGGAGVCAQSRWGARHSATNSSGFILFAVFAAGEVGGIVGIAGALVLRYRGIRAQGPRHYHLIVRRVFGGDHIFRGNTFLYPIDQGIKDSILGTAAGGDSQLAESGWARAAGAMLHTGRHA